MMKKRRGHNEGTIYLRKDGRYEGVVSLGDGRRKSYYGKTRQEVARKLHAAIHDRDRGLPILRDERLTVANYLTSWLDLMETNSRIRPSTHLRYTELLNRHAIPTLGKIPLTKLTPLQVEALYTKLQREGKASSKGLSSTTVLQLHRVLHHALKDALRKGLIFRNVTEMVQAPSKVRHEAKTLSADEALTLFASEAARSHRLYALVVLALYTGMREGEMLALTWRDVDLDRGLVEVRATLSRGKSGVTRGETKTDAGRRLLPLLPPVVEALQNHYVRQHTERDVAGSVWNDQGLVFTSETGMPLRGYAVLRNVWYPILERAGVRRVKLHEARHTTGTLLAREGVDSGIISALLGHSSVQITQDIYIHNSIETIRAAIAAAFQRLFGGATFSAILPSVLPSTEYLTAPDEAIAHGEAKREVRIGLD